MLTEAISFHPTIKIRGATGVRSEGLAGGIIGCRSPCGDRWSLRQVNISKVKAVVTARQHTQRKEHERAHGRILG